MKLLRAEFQNFRLLRDLELEFATDADRKLTVIRAANESGKTTILHALQWALYGDAVLPGKGEGFRLHPIDWDPSDGKRVPVTATVEFEVTYYRRRSTGLRESRQRYRLVRSAFEDVDSSARRAPSTIKLFELNDTGVSPYPEAEVLINEELPQELREVFFTDGDRALSFIEADVARSTKRERVENAIRSLLGLGVIEDAIKHVRKSASGANKKAKQVGSGSELNQIAARLEEIDELQEKLESDTADAKQQFASFEEKVNETDSKIKMALQKGDKQKLKTDVERMENEIKRLDNQLKSADREHSELFRSRELATDLLAPLLRRAFDELDKLRDQGKIPNTTIPVLQDRLTARVCICGESLETGETGGERRRAHIETLIEDSKKADEIQEIITSIYYEATSLQDGGHDTSSAWLRDYDMVFKRRDGLQEMRDEADRKLGVLERQIDSIPDTDIQGLRESLRHYKEQRDRHLFNQSSFETQLTGLLRERSVLETDRDRLLREQHKGALILAELEVAQDATNVLEGALERITGEELQKVSDQMNSICLEMIGSDPEQGAIIRRAEISRKFDIIVYGPRNRTLNPDRDLNGASRRALTLAFILALTQVSEVEAPNVIDTPLGMTSGFVKNSILQTSIRESAQLILFLTHDEIAGCEDVIDDTAGLVYTLSNSAHYPRMLINDPHEDETKIIRCECDHRSVCPLCQRRAEVDVELEVSL